ncbi:uncharacterized protein LOC130679953 [Manis pentadactyla]|uniref:uncharacterized protein LOC130679953 n=1 Tax=Manis pentadactyla TaxID=143292 RepID=UPI00255CB492|nr:uncharacterized protein LOC130679953 [Manis pentadactyla]
MSVQRPAQARPRMKAVGPMSVGRPNLALPRLTEELLPRLSPCSGPPSVSGPSVPPALRTRRSPDGGPALCSATPPSRRGGAGGAYLVRWAPRRRTRRFATLPRRTEGGDRLACRAAATAGPAPVQVGRLQPGAVARRDQEPRCGRGACGRLSPADRFAKAAESPAGKRLRPPGTCGGASRAGPASGVKATATALWAPSGRSITTIPSSQSESACSKRVSASGPPCLHSHPTQPSSGALTSELPPLQPLLCSPAASPLCHRVTQSTGWSSFYRVDSNILPT